MTINVVFPDHGEEVSRCRCFCGLHAKTTEVSFSGALPGAEGREGIFPAPARPLSDLRLCLISQMSCDAVCHRGHALYHPWIRAHFKTTAGEESTTCQCGTHAGACCTIEPSGPSIYHTKPPHTRPALTLHHAWPHLSRDRVWLSSLAQAHRESRWRRAFFGLIGISFRLYSTRPLSQPPAGASRARRQGGRPRRPLRPLPRDMALRGGTRSRPVHAGPRRVVELRPGAEFAKSRNDLFL